MTILLSALCCAAWLYLIAFHGRFWFSGPVLLRNGAPAPFAKLAVVVPARNEAETIRQCVGSLLSQDYGGEIVVIVVDDNSTDGTAQLVTPWMNEGRLTILPGKALPQGWSGKLWAVHQGLAHPDAQKADYVLLTDADIEHAPGHLSALINKAETDGLDLVSEMVHLHCGMMAERALVSRVRVLFPDAVSVCMGREPAPRNYRRSGRNHARAADGARSHRRHTTHSPPPDRRLRSGA